MKTFLVLCLAALCAGFIAIGCTPGKSQGPKVAGVGEAAECETYWRVIEDWSACSKPCGEGESRLKMKCSSSEVIKITSRPCNMQACK